LSICISLLHINNQILNTMKKLINTAEAVIDGVVLEVEFYIDGKYIPETRYEPAEYPEFIIETIKVQDSNQDCTELLIHLEEKIMNYITERL